MTKKFVFRLFAILILVIISISGCALNKPKTTTKVVSPATQVKPVNSNTKATNQLRYVITAVPSTTNIESNTPWEESALGKFKATIVGKGEQAEEEGYSNILIKNEKSGALQKLTLTNQEKEKLTAKDLEWIDENNLFVILGNPFGTVSRGGNIYKVNITDGVATLYMSTSNSKEEFISVHKTDSGFQFEKYVYEDSNFIKGHVESGKLELK